MSESNFTKGSPVIIYSMYENKLAEISKVTKTGQFETTMTGSTKFNPDGSERGSSAWRRSQCKIATDENIQQFKNLEKLKELSSNVSKSFDHSDKIKRLGIDKLSRILAIINE